MAEKKNFKNVENPAFAFLGDAVNKEVDDNDTEKYRLKIQELEKQLQEREYKEKETKSKKIKHSLSEKPETQDRHTTTQDAPPD